MWLNLAAKNDTDAAEDRDSIARKMTPEQIAEAKRLWALATASFLAVLTGTLAAIVLAVTISWGVTTLSDMLKR